MGKPLKEKINFFLQQTLPLYTSCTRLAIKDGRTTNLWYDTWLQNTIRQQIYGPLPQNEENRTVDSIIKTNRNYNYCCLQELPFHLPQSISLEILSHPIPKYKPPQKDRKILKLTKMTFFFFKISLSSYHKSIYYSSNKSKSF